MAGLAASLGLQGTSSERAARAHVMKYFILAMIYVIGACARQAASQRADVASRAQPSRRASSLCSVSSQ